jgi:2-succinyl-5-enolpyruvyl-6-hydroxy-3-cyclohexene-1-carboxylate synthase
MHALAAHVSEQQALFFANSMPIRDANLYFFPAQNVGPLFTNRGLSGIDGNIATVAGIAHGVQKPLIAVLGDLTALHDLNSLALLHKIAVPILLIVINNAGGAIFSFLPHLAGAPRFDELFSHHHEWEFSQAAALFSLPHHIPSSMSDLDAIIREFCTHPTTSLPVRHRPPPASAESEIRAQILQKKWPISVFSSFEP